MLGIVVGLAAEARVARGLGGRVAIGGGSTAGALDAARRLAAEGATALLSFGLAGGLDPALPAGALIIPNRVMGEQGQAWDTDPKLRARFLIPPENADTALLASNSIVGQAEAKQALWRHWSAVATDMESGAVAIAAQEAGLPFAVLRAICDTGNFELPPAAMTALGPDGQIKAWPLLSSLARRPGQIAALIRLGRQAACARRALQARVKLIGGDQDVQPGMRG